MKLLRLLSTMPPERHGFAARRAPFLWRRPLPLSPLPGLSGDIDLSARIYLTAVELPKVCRIGALASGNRFKRIEGPRRNHFAGLCRKHADVAVARRPYGAAEYFLGLRRKALGHPYKGRPVVCQLFHLYIICALLPTC